MKIIDATNLIVGRIATRAAKFALLGEDVVIVNSEKAVITGSKENVIAKYKRVFSMGVPMKGPYLHRMPDKILRRIVRGMLSHREPRGAAAYKRIKCFVGVPETLKDAKLETFEDANVSKVPSLNYIDLLTLSRRLGAKI